MGFQDTAGECEPLYLILYDVQSRGRNYQGKVFFQLGGKEPKVVEKSLEEVHYFATTPKKRGKGAFEGHFQVLMRR